MLTDFDWDLTCFLAPNGLWEGMAKNSEYQPIQRRLSTGRHGWERVIGWIGSGTFRLNPSRAAYGNRIETSPQKALTEEIMKNKIANVLIGIAALIIGWLAASTA